MHAKSFLTVCARGCYNVATLLSWEIYESLQTEFVAGVANYIECISMF